MHAWFAAFACWFLALAAQLLTQSPTLSSSTAAAAGFMPSSPRAASPLGGLFSLAQTPPHSGPFSLPSFGGSNTSLQRVASNTSLTRARQHSVGDEPLFSISAVDASPRMEGPIADVAPKLGEDILMDVSHVCTNQYILKHCDVTLCGGVMVQ